MAGVSASGDAAIGAAVARNLARLRKEQSLTLDELATRSGVSRTMLHQIEHGRSVPSIAVVWKLANGLGVAFGTLLEDGSAAPVAVQRAGEAKLLFNHDQTVSTRALFPVDGQRRPAELYELRLKPGGVEHADAHAPGTSEIIILVRGSALEITIAGAMHRIAPGDAISFAADRPHAYRNPDQDQEAVAYLAMGYRSA